MQIRKDRTHQCGLSNIDFKTRKDEEGAKLFKEDFRNTMVGTMGKSGMKKLLKPANQNTSLKIASGFYLPQPPNPKKDISTAYYEKTGRILNNSQNICSQKDSLLESNKFDGKPSIGEDTKMTQWYSSKAKPSGQITDNDTIAQNQAENANSDDKLIQLKGDKKDKNEKALTETQIVKVPNNSTLEGKVDVEKVRGIRRTIRRRYGNRTNFRKLFNNWDRTSKGYVDASDACHMLCKLGIKINPNEAAVLIGSADKSNNGRLGMDEFMGLIFGNEEAFNVDLKKLRTTSQDDIIEGAEGLVSEMGVVTKNLKQIEELNEIRQLLKRKTNDLFCEIQYGRMERHMDYDRFKKVLAEKAELPEKYRSDNYIQLLFNGANSNGKIDFIRFLESVRKFTIHESVESELGPSKERSAMSKTVNKFSSFHSIITSNNKIPINKLDYLIERAKKLSHIIQTKYPQMGEFEKLLKEKCDQQRVPEQALEGFLVDELKSDLVKREITRDDIKCFLFALPYDNNRSTTAQNVITCAYSY
jgi:Ca2+-binding EF-hand superfamily protein